MKVRSRIIFSILLLSIYINILVNKLEEKNKVKVKAIENIDNKDIKSDIGNRQSDSASMHYYKNLDIPMPHLNKNISEYYISDVKQINRKDPFYMYEESMSFLRDSLYKFKDKIK